MLSYDVERWLRKNLLVPTKSAAYVRLADGTLMGIESIEINDNEDLVFTLEYRRGADE